MSESRSVLLFDLGGVLIESDMFSQLKRLMKSGRSEAELIDMWLDSPIAREFELGRCPMEEFSQRIVRELQLSIEPDEFLRAFKTWPKGLYRGADKVLAALRRSHTVCCLSNSNEAHWTDAITGHFDDAFSSHLIGHIKPDRDAFAHVVSELGVRPEEVSFFDDAKANVDAAREFGLQAHHTIGYERLKSKLRELGLHE